MMGRGGIRVVRGLVLSLACVMLSLGMHVAAGGSLHVDVLSVLGIALLVIGCVAAAGQRGGFGAVFGIVSVSQLVLHTLVGGHGQAAASSGSGLTMVLAHLLAALVVSVLLIGAERVLWVLAAVLRPFVLPRTRPDGPMPVAVRPWWPPVRRAATSRALVGAAGVRGPPVGCTV